MCRQILVSEPILYMSQCRCKCCKCCNLWKYFPNELKKVIIRKYFQEKRKGWSAPSTSSPTNSVMKTKLDIRIQCVRCSFTNIITFLASCDQLDVQHWKVLSENFFHTKKHLGVVWFRGWLKYRTNPNSEILAVWRVKALLKIWHASPSTFLQPFSIQRFGADFSIMTTDVRVR